MSQSVLKQLSTVKEVNVTKNGSIDQIARSTNIFLIHHYQIAFLSNLCNIGNIIADSNYLVTTNGIFSIYIYDDDNNVDHLNG